MSAERPVDPEADAAVPDVGRRAQHRLARTQEYLRTALDIVTTEGFDALTMQRLADECDSAIGAVYRYFPSKGALVAEVQAEAVDRLSTSYALVRARTDAELAPLGLPEAELALIRVVLLGRWFIALSDSHPQELRLLLMLIGEARVVVPVEEGMRVLPRVIRLLDTARACLDDAVDAGIIDTRSDSMTRVVTWAAAVGGVLQASRLDVYDADLFIGPQMTLSLTMDLFRAWGASRDELDVANEVVDRLAVTGPLAPR
jgi:AcrR family transcriptional regulator